MATPSIVIVQSFTYRDNDEEWSNRYHFTGDEPADHAAWKTLADGLIALLRPTQKNTTSYVRAYGYHQDGDPAVAVIDYTTGGLSPAAGSLSTSSAKAPGDAASMVRWDTGRTNSRGKKIYLRKYFHGVVLDPTDNDKVSSDQHAANETFADAVISDLGDGDHAIAGPDGVGVSVAGANEWVTTRTLKRRGRRPPS